MVNYLNFHNSSFALRFFLFFKTNVNGKATQCDTPVVFPSFRVVSNAQTIAQFVVKHFWNFLELKLDSSSPLYSYLHVLLDFSYTPLFVFSLKLLD